MVLETIGQFVRRDSGGDLGKLYRRLRAEAEHQTSLIEFVRKGASEDVMALHQPATAMSQGGEWARTTRTAQHHMKGLWTHIILSLLPRASRVKNVNLSSVGELHQWQWDFHQLRNKLAATGFGGIPIYPLPIDQDGRPRKSAESMNIEAQKTEIGD